MELKQAKMIAQDFLKEFETFFIKSEVCGSIRRECQEVNDIDIVVISKDGFIEHLKARYGLSMQGNKILRFVYKKTDFDVYLATNDNFEVLRLIRTGSAQHNIKLCSTAKRKGMKLKANGEGLILADGTAVKTERAILETLLGKYIEPKDR